MKAAIYLRVSTATKDGDQFRQNHDVQKKPLLDLCESRGWTVHKIYSDRMSGVNSSRPGYKALIEDARRGLFQVVLVWKFDRWARSLKDLVMSLDEFRSLNVAFISHTEAVDTGTPMGRMIFGIIAALAEFERDMIQERVRAGIEHARQFGTRSGKLIGGQKKVFRQDKVIELRRDGRSYREICRELGLGLGTVQRICSTDLPPSRLEPDTTERAGRDQSR
jgi:DNA invertase Pin-like site-specific DNA recombinase